LLLGRVGQDVEDRALRAGQPRLLLGSVGQDVEDRALRAGQPRLLLGSVVEDVKDGAGVAPRVDPPAVRHRAVHAGVGRAHSFPGPFFRSSISFLSSIILSSRPTVSFWNRSSSASRSSSLLRCSAISASALLCPPTLPA